MKKLIIVLLFLSGCMGEQIITPKYLYTTSTSTSTTTTVLVCPYETDCPQCSEAQLQELSKYLDQFNAADRYTKFRGDDRACFLELIGNIDNRLIQIRESRFQKTFSSTVKSIENAK